MAVFCRFSVSFFLSSFFLFFFWQVDEGMSDSDPEYYSDADRGIRAQPSFSGDGIASKAARAMACYPGAVHAAEHDTPPPGPQTSHIFFSPMSADEVDYWNALRLIYFSVYFFFWSSLYYLDVSSTPELSQIRGAQTR